MIHLNGVTDDPKAFGSRQALLDLSTRNRLLSLPQAATARVLHFADERTDEAA